jgi:hypothetical protein
MVFGDILMMYRHFSSDPLPFSTPKMTEALKIKHAIKDLKIWWLDLLSMERRDLGP